MKTQLKKRFFLLLIVMVFTPFLMAPPSNPCPHCNVNLVPIEAAVKPYGTGSLVVVWIKNGGPEASKDFWVDVFVTSKVAPKTEKTSEHYLWSYGVKGDGVQAVTIVLPQSPEELEWLDVIVDSTGMAPEVIEKDNTREFDLRGGVR